MGVLSDCVLAHQGVLVDYIGDELMAMWGAPQEEPDHAQLACRAALDMLDRAPRAQRALAGDAGGADRPGHRHQHRASPGSATPARTGSSSTAPLGNTVNLASRVQGATKYLKTRLLITGHDPGQARRDASPRAGSAQVARGQHRRAGGPLRAGRPGPARLGRPQVGLRAGPDRIREHATFGTAIRILGNLLAERPDDGPSLVLLSRAVDCMVEDRAEFDPVWKLPGK